MALPPSAHMGAVILDVRDLGAMATFYEKVIGLNKIADGDGDVILGRGSRPIVVLRENRALPLRPTGSAGLFHTAILYQSHAHLAAALGRVARYAPQLYTGSGDHHVSEAFYLDDPEGNGIELYIDRPKDQWRWTNGSVYMTTDYLDPQAFIDTHHTPDVELGTDPVDADPTILGHVHLQVGDVDTAREFYVDKVGFDLTLQYGPSAIFVSAGGYHHHMAMNTWATKGAGPRTPSLGLGRAEILVPSRDDALAVAERVGQVRDDGNSVIFNDPWNNEITLTPAS